MVIILLMVLLLILYHFVKIIIVLIKNVLTIIKNSLVNKILGFILALWISVLFIDSGKFFKNYIYFST